jgi:fused signal recognition particle receptor
MFKFLKEKLKGAVSQLSDKIEEEGQEEVKEEIKEQGPSAKEVLEEVSEEKGFFSKLKDKFAKEEAPEEKESEIPKEEPKVEEPAEEVKEEAPKEEVKETPIEEPKEEVEDIPKEEKSVEKVKKEEKGTQTTEESDSSLEFEQELQDMEDKKGFLGKIKEKIVTKKINEKQFDEMFWDLEVVLLENNVAVEVIEKIKQDLRTNLVDRPIKRGQVSDTILTSLKDTINALFDVESIDVIEKAKGKKPFVICFVGINGSGKTTTIAKFAKLLENNGLSCVLAAADTFRAAAIDQLQTHADKLNVKLIKHDYGSDAAAVAFDAVKHAESKGIDVVLIDTAGRMHSNVNLMDEMNKIIRVANPDLKIFVGESITGNDCTEQAKKFNETISIDGIILSKADIDEKGGAAISVSHVTGKPILFIGTGQEYKDLEKFDSHIILNNLGF